MNQNENKVKYYPRLLTGEMVRAVLAGHKTATRWPLRKQPVEDVAKRKGEWVWEDVDGHIFPAPVRPGDVIWVRETWSQENAAFPPVYRADGIDMLGNQWTEEALSEVRWRPGIHMPRKCARLMLRVTDVKLIRVQDISEPEAQAEGSMPEFEMNAADFIKGVRRPTSTYFLGFKHIWQQLYDSGPHAWNANPWVWAASFHRISRDEAREACRG